MNKEMNFKNVLINLCILAAAVVISLILIEIILRLLLNTELNILETDNYMLYKGRPNISFKASTGKFVNNITFNNYGFFDKEWKKKKDTDVRILVVGDSFTAGFNADYDKNYARLLENLINKDNISVDMMVAGIPSWSTSNELKFLERIGLDFKPDIIILEYYGNDVKDNYLRGLFSLKDGQLIDNTPINISLRKRVMVYMSGRSVLFKRIYDFLLFNPIAKKIAPRLLDDASVKYYREKECDDCNLFLLEPDDVYSAGFNITHKLLEKFDMMGKDYNFTPVLLIIPEKIQVEDSYWKESVLKAGGQGKMLQDLYQRRIKALTPKDMLIIDPYPIFKKENLNTSLFLKYDIHTNVNGNKIMAEMLYSNLKAKRLITKKNSS